LYLYLYNNPVTLKASLRVTKGHRKWNHLIDHIRLAINIGI